MFVGFADEYLLAMGGAWLAVIGTLLLAMYLQPWRSRRNWIRRAAKPGLTAWMLAFLLVVAETVFALGYDSTDTFALCRTSKRWYERHVALNNMGFRDQKRFQDRKPVGRSRIVLLGDSFAFGHGVKDPNNRFGDILEKKCIAESEDGWELYNISQQGLPTSLMVERLDQLAADGFELDVLLLAYNLNDVEDLDENSRHVIGTIILDQPSSWVVRECYLPNFLYYRSQQFTRPELQGYFHWLVNAYHGEVWDTQRRQLDEIREWCDRRGVELLVVIFPSLVDMDDYQFDEAHRVLNEYWQDNDVPVLDLLPILRPHAAEGLIVNRFDAHPNERAHELAASAIWEELLRPRVSAMDRDGDRE